MIARRAAASVELDPSNLPSTTSKSNDGAAASSTAGTGAATAATSSRSGTPLEGNILAANGSTTMVVSASGSSGTHVAGGGASSHQVPATPAGSYIDPLSLPVESRKTILWLMCVLKVATSFDAGAFSFAVGTEGGISQALNLDNAQSGFLGSSVYIGNVIGCACCAFLFQRHSAKYLLNVGMLLHAVFTLLFAVSSSFLFAILARIGIGFTLSFVVVYSVVWADVFSPPKNATLWLAMLNIGVPAGTLAGFLCGGMLMNYFTYSWRWIFVTKTLAMVPMLVFMSHVDAVMIDDPGTITPGPDEDEHVKMPLPAGMSPPASPTVRVAGEGASFDDHATTTTTTKHKKSGSGGVLHAGASSSAGTAAISVPAPVSTSLSTSAAGATSNHSNNSSSNSNSRDKDKDHPHAHVAVPQWDVWNSFLGNHLMILNVAGLSVLYFVVTGMQVFFTQYLREPPFSATVTDIMVSFGITAVSSPIVGVATGGYAMDRFGNYREHPSRAATLGAVAATLAAIFGVFTTMATSIATLSIHLWLMLFFGAAALPSAMGLIVASVPPDQKNAASSFANIMFNVWGYFAGPMFCGVVAQHTNSLRVAIGATLNVGWLGVVFFWWSAKIAGVTKIYPPASPRGGGELSSVNGSAFPPPSAGVAVSSGSRPPAAMPDRSTSASFDRDVEME